MFGKGSGTKKPHELFMNRKETAVWLGRSMSTGEITLRSLVQLLPIISFQQQVIQAMFERLQSGQVASPSSGSLAEMEAGASQEILKKLAELEEQLKPVLEVVDQACSQLEKEIG